jgi:hypothetical protein
MVVNTTTVDARAVLKDRMVLAGAALVLATLGTSGWLLFGADFGENAVRFTHMHCSECRDEVAFDGRKVGTTCVSCGQGTYTATAGSILDGGEALSAGGKALVFLLVAAVLLQGLVYLGVIRLRALRRAEEEARNQMLVCRCPFCQRKIGYAAVRIGSGVVCSRCKTAFSLPSAEEV